VLSSTFAIARYPGWSSSEFASKFSATICGVMCGAFAKFTNVEMSTRTAPRGRNLRKYGAGWRCSNKIASNSASTMHQQCTRRNCALLQSQADATRGRLPSSRVPSRCSQAVCRHKRAHCKLENRQMAEQTGASGPLGGATTAQGADRVPSLAPPAPAALAGRCRRKNRTIDERHAPMDAYAKTTSLDSKLGATITERRFLKSCPKAPHPGEL
jgi:hypothetical protein